MSWNGKEKRRFVRAKFPCKIIVNTPEEYTIVSHTEDIGTGGIRVIIPDKLNISSIVGFEIFLKNGGIKGKGRVVWVVNKGNSLFGDGIVFDTGVEFIEISEEDRRVVDNFVESVISSKK